MEIEPRKRAPNAEPPSLRAWESLAESRLQAAIDGGEFQNLPGMGKPLPDVNPNDKHWWLKQKCRDEGLEVLPPALELKRDVERAWREIEESWERHRDVERLHGELSALNRLIAERNVRVGWGPPSDVQPFDIDKEIAILLSRQTGECDQKA